MTQPGTGRCRVLLAGAPLSVLDYAVPAGMAVAPGLMVRVPLGPRQFAGVVWDEDDFAAPPVAEAKLRPIAGLLNAPPLSPELRRLIGWVSRYYVANPASVLRMAMSVGDALDGDRLADVLVPTGAPLALTARQQQALQRLAGRQGSAAELARATGITPAMIRTLQDKGALVKTRIAADAPYPQPDTGHAPPQLSAEQAAAATVLEQAVRAKRYEAFLLDGVTGSGKTEVYFEAVRAALDAGHQVLVLLPEIALTGQWLTRFEQRFGCEPVVWHSSLRPAERRRAWRAVGQGTARVLVGARSALFLPFARLGLIVVDEEHEASFKQDEGVCYQGRDVAVMRAMQEAIPVVLASATPSLESLLNARQGRYRHVTLPSRFGGARMPAIGPVDLRRAPPAPGRWLSAPLVEAIGQTLARREQSLLFLNRRGYAPLTLCRACGERLSCPQCAAWLVEHRLTGRLQCHHCGFASPIPKACPSCEAQGTLVPCGPGVERVAEEVTALYPSARVLIVTSDTMATPDKVRQMVESVTQGVVDIIVGTQLVAKGHHFPNLTLVGVVDADIGLGGGDLRAAERTYQQITQVAGRAGRAERAGQVLLQTWQPEQAVLRALLTADRQAFEEAELAARERHRMPPFGRLAALIISGPDERQVVETAQSLARSAPGRDGIVVLGPAPAPLALLRGRHRQRLLVKADKGLRLGDIIGGWLAQARWPAKIHVQVDIDPYSFV